MNNLNPETPSTWSLSLIEAKALFALGWPLMLAQVLQLSMGFVDTIMTGHYSALHLAAVSIGEKSLITFILLGLGIINATQILVAQMVGAKTSSDQIGFLVVQGFWVGQIYGVFAWVIVRNILPYLTFLDIEPQVLNLAQDYLEAFSWGIPGFYLFAALRGFYEGIAITYVTLFFSILGVVVNLIGNYVLIFGNFGAPEMGGVGAGWTSALSSWTMGLGLLIYTIVRKENRAYQFFSQLFKISWVHVKQILNIGLPVGLSFFLEISVFAIFGLLMAKFGVIHLASNQIALNYAALIFMIPLGLGIASTTQVGIAIGKKDLNQAKIIGWVSIGLGGALMSISSVSLLIFSEWIARIYSSDPDVIQTAAGFLALAGVFQIADGFQVTAINVLKGWKDTKFPLMMNFFNFWVIGLVLGYVLAFNMEFGPNGLWYGLIAGLGLAALSHCGRLVFIIRKNVK